MRDLEKLRAYQRAWVAKRRADFLAGKSCVSCGSLDRLEVDHIDPKTKTHHAVWSWADERRRTELAKCQVLCNSCHMEKSLVDGSRAPRRHGTRTGYDRGCRCQDCRDGKAMSMREWRAKKRAV